MSLPNSPRSSSGFTLIELMVVMTVIAILAGMVLYGLSSAQAAARDVSRQQVMTGIQTALERFYGDNQSYPSGNICQLFSVAPTVGMSNYASAPTDPGTKTSICDGVKCVLSGSTTTCTIGSKTAKYTYTPGASPAQSYSLVLIKEAGGTVTFTDPQ